MLRDNVAIVTGGTRGIGKAIVAELINAHAKVVFTYLNNCDAARIILDEINGVNGVAEAISADVRNFSEAKRVVQETVAKFGTVDMLINNAGITKDKALMMMDVADWQEVIDTNLTGYFNMSRASIVTMMKAKRGNIVNISSVSGVVGFSGQINYSSAKAGIIGMTKALAKEVAPYNIRVNAVAPGFIETDMTKDLKRKDDLIKLIPASRFGMPQEVAKTVIFLLSNRSTFITGQVIKVDGGLAI